MIIKRNIGNDICSNYRPRKLSEVYGNNSQIKAIEKAFNSPTRPHVMLFIGSAGCAKTTVARILAMGLNCEHGDTVEPCLECDSCKSMLDETALFFEEINCAKYSGKGDAFNISELMSQGCFTGRNKVYILDEFHMLNKQGQNLLLKDFEEPPENVYIFACTSQPDRIDKALFQRFDTYNFKNPTEHQISCIAKDICKQEGWNFLDDQIEMNKFIEAVNGFSFRQVVKSVEKAHNGGINLIQEVQFDDKPEIIEIVRMMFNSGDFNSIVKKIKSIKDEFEWESFRMISRAYAESILVNNGMNNKAKSLAMVEIIKILEIPYYDINTPKYFSDIFSICYLIGETCK